eukprot:scaffold57656_cov63-Phaeocystis_antarctica.AAC.1
MLLRSTGSRTSWFITLAARSMLANSVHVAWWTFPEAPPPMGARRVIVSHSRSHFAEDGRKKRFSAAVSLTYVAAPARSNRPLHTMSIASTRPRGIYSHTSASCARSISFFAPWGNCLLSRRIADPGHIGSTGTQLGSGAMKRAKASGTLACSMQSLASRASVVRRVVNSKVCWRPLMALRSMSTLSACSAPSRMIRQRFLWSAA